MEDELTAAEQAYIDKIMDEFRKEFPKIANEVNEIYWKNINNMFDSFIEQYYKYKTLSYVRHFQQKPGTGTGEHLQLAKNFKIHNRSRYFQFEGSPSEAFKQFFENYYDMMYPVFMRRWNKVMKQWEAQGLFRY